MCSGISSLGSATRPSGNSGKFWTSCTVNPEYGSGRNSDDEFDRSRLVPARPARARSPAAAGGARRPRARRPGVRARRPAARRPPRLGQPHAVPARVPRGPARRARAARREPRDRPRHARARAAEAGRAIRRDGRLLRVRREPVRDAPRPARRGGAADPLDRAAPHARELRRRHRQAQAVRGLHPVLARVAGAAAAGGPRRAARRDGTERPGRRGDPAAAARQTSSRTRCRAARPTRAGA